VMTKRSSIKIGTVQLETYIASVKNDTERIK
jgi:hypothetical protein